MRFLLLLFLCLPASAQDTLTVDLAAWDRRPGYIGDGKDAWEMRLNPRTNDVAFQQFAVFPTRWEPRRTFVKIGSDCYTSHFRAFPGPRLIYKQDDCGAYDSVYRQYLEILIDHESKVTDI